jgi:hypothetical protein
MNYRGERKKPYEGFVLRATNMCVDVLGRGEERGGRFQRLIFGELIVWGEHSR